MLAVDKVNKKPIAKVQQWKVTKIAPFALNQN